MRIRSVVHLAFLSAGLIAASGVHATTFGFAASPGNFVTSYQGFNWSGSAGGNSWVNGSAIPLLGSPSAPLGYAWSNGGADLSMSLASAGTFTFNSISVYGDHTKWGGNSSVLTIKGWLAGNEVNSFTTATTLDAMPRDVYTTLSLNWSNIDSVTFSTPSGENLLVGDITVNGIAPVPEPETYAMMLAGLGLLGLAARRRRQQTTG